MAIFTVYCADAYPQSQQQLCLNNGNLFFLKQIFNSRLVHGYFLDAAPKGHIEPLAKNKFGCNNDSVNYTEIMHCATLFKVLEHFVLPEITA